MKLKAFSYLALLIILSKPVQAAPLIFDRFLTPLGETDRLYIDEIHLNPDALGVYGFFRKNVYGLNKKDLMKTLRNGFGYDYIKSKPTQAEDIQLIEMRNRNSIFSSYLFVLQNDVTIGYVLPDTPFIRDVHHPKSPVPTILQYAQDQYIQLTGLPTGVSYTSHVRQDNGFIERFVLLHVPSGNNPGYWIQGGTGLSVTFILLSSYYPQSLDQELQAYQNEEVQKRLDVLKSAELEIMN
jgi:hypothetical protein